MYRNFVLLLFFTVSLYSQKEIIINLSSQQLIAKEKNKVFLRTAISSGRYGHETPSGNFKIILKDKKHKSNIYPIRTGGEWITSDGAEMPYTLKFKESGEAIHAGSLPGYPASHGCVRIPIKKAQQLFSWAKINTKVKIINKTKYKRINIEKKDNKDQWGEDYFINDMDDSSFLEEDDEDEVL